MVHKLVACATAAGRSRRLLIEQLCDVLRPWGYAARFGPASLDRVGMEEAGNCIDLSALLCAALRRRGIEHCYVVLGSRLGEFPAGVHAWVLTEEEPGISWLLVDPEGFHPESCDPRALTEQMTILAIFNDQKLVVGSEQHAAFFEEAWQGGDDQMEQDPGTGVGATAAAARPARNEPVVIEEQGAGFHAVLANAAGNVMITNDLGRYVLDLCDGSKTAQDIAAELAAKYPDVPRARIARDIDTFIDTAISKGALTWH